MTDLKLGTVREIKRYPSMILKQVCKIVTTFDIELEQLVNDMFTTMYMDNGVGLAASQVGILKRIFVIDTSNSGDKRRVFINPVIISGKLIERQKEGCLSFPGVFAFVRRYSKISVKAQDEKGEEFTLDLEGLDAICFQHELDHLGGITFYDHLSMLQKNMIRKKISKIK
jgi:peptide deformylase